VVVSEQQFATCCMLVSRMAYSYTLKMEATYSSAVQGGKTWLQQSLNQRHRRRYVWKWRQALTYPRPPVFFRYFRHFSRLSVALSQWPGPVIWSVLLSAEIHNSLLFAYHSLLWRLRLSGMWNRPSQLECRFPSLLPSCSVNQ
jgi:hypothetical protein